MAALSEAEIDMDKKEGSRGGAFFPLEQDF
jgi:hypothetical protein